MNEIMNTTEHRFPYRWTLKDAVFTKDKGKQGALLSLPMYQISNKF